MVRRAPSGAPLRTPFGRALALTGLLVIGGFGVGGCSTHNDVGVSRPCTSVVKGGKVLAVGNRGAIAMAKVGLTPQGLKAQEKCK